MKLVIHFPLESTQVEDYTQLSGRAHVHVGSFCLIVTRNSSNTADEKVCFRAKKP
jgi:hypothetical protein